MGTHPIFESDFDCLTEMEFIATQLADSKLKSVNFKSPLGDLTFSRSSQPTNYEINENIFLSKVCGNKLKKAWFLRPKIEVISEEDKENINSNQINHDYFDNRGAPAPAP